MQKNLQITTARQESKNYLKQQSKKQLIKDFIVEHDLRKSQLEFLQEMGLLNDYNEFVKKGKEVKNVWINQNYRN